MPTINRYVDISTIDKEAKKDFIDRHSPFVHCEGSAKKGENFCVKVKMGEEYTHPDDFNHYIAYVQLWDGETLVGQANLMPSVVAGDQNKAHLEVHFTIMPQKSKLNLVAMSYCTKHGLWESTPIEVEVEG